MTELETIRQVMDLLPASECSYEEWCQIGMIAKDVGMSVGEWDLWSRADVRYKDGECSRKWQSFDKRNYGSRVAIGTAVEICKRHGRWEIHAADYADFDPDSVGWDDAIPDTEPKPGQVIRSEYVAPVVIREPKDNWRPCEDMMNYLKALFRDDEGVSYCVTAMEYTRKDGSKTWRPVTAGITEKAGDLIEKLKRQNAKPDPDIGWVIGDWNREAGVWVRVNPMNTANGDDLSVSSYRHALVECDQKTPEEQLAIIRKLELPCAAIIHSGGKSVHAVVKIEADTESEYQKRVDYLFDICKNNGLPLDRQNRNPSRYSRLPGVTRGDRKQYLIDTDCGKTSWQEWHEWIEAEQDTLPDFESADDFIDNPPPLADAIIDGVLRKGHKMLLSGPSKAGKSFLLLELAIAVAEGSDWLGWKCAQGRVLYINLELDSASCKNRIHDLYHAKGMRHTAKSLDVWNLRGQAAPLKLLKDKLIRRARNASYSLIIIDPIYKVITGDENAAAEMAQFCNCFDEIATACKCAMVYCHHHSKGEQGQKKAQDRASGSGVFARDPDALLDMIQLDIGETRLNAIMGRHVCDCIAEYLDGKYPNWRHVISLDDALVADRLIAAASELAGKDTLEAIAEEARKDIRSATAWRIDGILREFPSFPPKNIWYLFPTHFVDTTGMLQDVLADGQAPKKNDKIAQNKKERDEKETKIAEVAFEFEELACKTGECTVKALADAMKMTEKQTFTFVKKNHKNLNIVIDGTTLRRKQNAN